MNCLRIVLARERSGDQAIGLPPFGDIGALAREQLVGAACNPPPVECQSRTVPAGCDLHPDAARNDGLGRRRRRRLLCNFSRRLDRGNVDRARSRCGTGLGRAEVGRKPEPGSPAQVAVRSLGLAAGSVRASVRASVQLAAAPDLAQRQPAAVLAACCCLFHRRDRNCVPCAGAGLRGHSWSRRPRTAAAVPAGKRVRSAVVAAAPARELGQPRSRNGRGACQLGLRRGCGCRGPGSAAEACSRRRCGLRAELSRADRPMGQAVHPCRAWRPGRIEPHWNMRRYAGHLGRSRWRRESARNCQPPPAGHA